jgi:PAS domain S-box-containing protein
VEPSPQQRLLDLIRADLGLTLLDHLPDVAVFVKDLHGRFVLANPACVRMLGAKRETEVIGRLDPAFSPKHLCEKYAVDDARVLATGTPLIDKLELARNRDGSIGWYTTTKLAIRDGDGAIIGLAGLTRDLKKMGSASAPFLAMAPVIETIMDDYAKPLTMAGLAAKLGLSVSQFERQFKKRFATTPLKYLIQVRINAACELLTTTGQAIAAIALGTGFYDQSHFTNQFLRLKGMSPSRYREAYSDSGPGPAPLSHPHHGERPGLPGTGREPHS